LDDKDPVDVARDHGKGIQTFVKPITKYSNL
jgi:hypothetical protein